jgi:hypothetical protein
VESVAEFLTREEAEEERVRREAEVRARLNPFICGQSFAHLTRLPEAIFLDWLQDAGIMPPLPDKKSGRREWAGWWDRSQAKLTPEHLAHVWAALDRVRFFDVAERRCPVGYAVVRVDWEYNDNWFRPGAEGGTPLHVFRKRSDAVAYLQLQQGEPEASEDEETEYSARYEVNRWEDEATWPFVGDRGDWGSPKLTVRSKAPQFEIIEIELPRESGRG